MATVFPKVCRSIELFSHHDRQKMGFKHFLGCPDRLVGITKRDLGDAFGVGKEVRTIEFQQQLVLFVCAAGDTVWVMWGSIAIHWAMVVAVVILVRVIRVHQYTAWSTLIIMNITHAIGVIYRFRTGKWRKIELIG